MTLDQAKDLAAVVGGLVAVVALVKGVWEYTVQGAQKRAEHFLNMRKRFEEFGSYKEICVLLEVDDPSLSSCSFVDKMDFLGFYEELALLVNSGLIRDSVAHYMFGYYALRCWESNHFWTGVNRESPYWSLFRDFVSRMKAREKSFKYSRLEFTFRSPGLILLLRWFTTGSRDIPQQKRRPPQAPAADGRGRR